MRRLIRAVFEEKKEIPEEIIQELGAMGLMGMGIPTESGGMGLGYGAYLRIFGEIAGVDASVAALIGAHQSIGYRALVNEGSDEQKKKWLPLLAGGEKIAAFCLTEPGSGSDAYSIKTRAVKNDDGSYTITGQKLWITNGGLADFYTVFCKTEHEEDGKTQDKISAFILEKGMEGLSFGEKENKLGICASETRALYFDKVRVPAENLIGEPGRGFKTAMNVLNMGRLSLSAGCVGAMKRVLKLAVEHASSRKQFGQTIDRFGMIQKKLAEMAADTYAAESVIFMTAGNIARGMDNFQLESSICKVWVSETSWETVNSALQVAAGSGYMKDYPYERILRDTRINLIFEGTNEVLRCFLALSGLKGPSEHMKELGKIADISAALQAPLQSLGVLIQFADSRIEKLILSKGLTKHHAKLQQFADYFSEMLSAFSIQVENSLIKHGKDIVNRQLIQKRLSDMVIHLYVILAVISRTSTILESKKATEEQKKYVLDLTRLSCRKARYRFMAGLKEMSKNSDKEIITISQQLSVQGGYGLDIIDF